MTPSSQGIESPAIPGRFITRARLDWALTLISNVAADGHMDALGLVDTFGVCNPHAIGYLVQEIRKRFPHTRLEAHFHMDFGMGVANTILALAAGVEVFHSTMLGIGERAGNAPMEQVVLALRLLYNMDIGVDLSRLYQVGRLVAALAGQPVPRNKPVLGEGLFDIESGIIATWFCNCGDEFATEVFPYRPEVVGQRMPKIVLGKGSGVDSVLHWLERLGIDSHDADFRKRVLSEVKRRSLATKRLLTETEFREITKLLGGNPPSRKEAIEEKRDATDGDAVGRSR